ncbi:MAG: RcnB family protein [Reyranella sp.]|nr:RcnB family protein [Reyranella sp.]
MRTVSIAFISLLCTALMSPALADNDKNKGGGPKADKHDNDNNKGRGNSGPVFEQRAIVGPSGGPIVIVPYQQIVVVDRDRTLVRTYYRNEYVAGRCPPGLAKKNNGCLPPGQAKKMWSVGQPLPPEVVYYPIQRELWTQLTPPPYGYEYVQVDDDIVLILTATRVIAALLGNVGSFD